MFFSFHSGVRRLEFLFVFFDANSCVPLSAMGMAGNSYKLIETIFSEEKFGEMQCESDRTISWCHFSQFCPSIGNSFCPSSCLSQKAAKAHLPRRGQNGASQSSKTVSSFKKVDRPITVSLIGKF
jgi:hypothetical protein